MKKIFIISLFVYISLIFNQVCFSQWLTDEAKNPICMAANSQDKPSIVTDGSSGAIICWYDYRNSSTTSADIYAQRISAGGVIQWTLDGIAVCTSNGAQYDPLAVSDGTGGAIIVWEDQRSGNWNIYAQRINGSGITQWTLNGVEIRTKTGNIYRPGELAVISDGNGGAIISWTEETGYDIYAQKINHDGSVAWADDGIAICVAAEYQLTSALGSDGNGGAIISWTDNRTGGMVSHNLLAKRVDSDGNTVWGGATGISICSANEIQRRSAIVSDGSAGAFIVWEDMRNVASYPIDIYCKRIDADGNTYAGWPADGLAVCTAANDQIEPKLINDGTGGIIITWTDSRLLTQSDVYAQRINGNGTIYTGWAANGEDVCTVSNNQSQPQIASDGNNGAIIAWNDRRGGSNYDVYAQRIGSNGSLQWPGDGVTVSAPSAGGNQNYIKLISDGNSGAILTWYCDRDDNNIYASQIDGNGNIGTLPVELVSFTAAVTGNEVTLKWQTATEINNYGFEIERSLVNGNAIGTGQSSVIPNNPNSACPYGKIPNQQWELVGFVEGHGNSNSPKEYSFIDENPTTGNLQYRLKQIDTDGKFEYYSPIAVVTYNLTDVKEKQLPTEFALEQNYPNPFNPSTVISFQLPVISHATLKVYDLLGNEVTTLINEVKSAGTYTVRFDAGKYNLSSGIYFYTIKAGEFTATKKLMLMK